MSRAIFRSFFFRSLCVLHWQCTDIHRAAFCANRVSERTKTKNEKKSSDIFAVASQSVCSTRTQSERGRKVNFLSWNYRVQAEIHICNIHSIFDVRPSWLPVATIDGQLATVPSLLLTQRLPKRKQKIGSQMMQNATKRKRDENKKEKRFTSLVFLAWKFSLRLAACSCPRRSATERAKKLFSIQRTRRQKIIFYFILFPR